MAHQVAMIHTLSSLVDVFSRLSAELLPGARLLHIVDEPLLTRVRQRGHLAPEDSLRLGSHVDIAQQVGASAALVTCSTISPCVDDVLTKTSVPVIKIDGAMIAQAVTKGGRIGVVATNEATLEPTRQLLQAQAEAAGKEIETELVLVEHALQALLGGDGVTHDRLVRERALRLSRQVDVVVLAQASMARVLEIIPEGELKVPILSSPHLALGQVRHVLRSAG
jgi:Asp/Glu/hydantoin racemase